MVKTKENIKLKNKEIKELKEYICDKTNRTSIKSQSNTLNKKKTGGPKKTKKADDKKKEEKK